MDNTTRHVCADDEDDLLPLYVRWLTSDDRGPIDLAHNGREALRICMTHILHGEDLVVLTDNDMPDGTGVQLVAALRAIERLSGVRIGIIMISSDRPIIFERLDGFLQKPATRDELLEVINKVAPHR